MLRAFSIMVEYTSFSLAIVTKLVVNRFQLHGHL